jgi:hypothetical protein
MGDEVRSMFLYERSKELLRERLYRRDGEEGLPKSQPARIHAFDEYGRLIAEEAARRGLPVLESQPFSTLLSRAEATLERR